MPRAVRRSFAWCELHGLGLMDLKPMPADGGRLPAMNAETIKAIRRENLLAAIR
jgi:hypothetical protein